MYLTCAVLAVGGEQAKKDPHSIPLHILHEHHSICRSRVPPKGVTYGVYYPTRKPGAATATRIRVEKTFPTSPSWCAALQSQSIKPRFVNCRTRRLRHIGFWHGDLSVLWPVAVPPSKSIWLRVNKQRMLAQGQGEHGRV